MERDVAWKKYDEADLEALEHLAAEYIDFISDNKTERECAASAVALAEEHGYLPLDQAVREGRTLKAGDKVWAQAHGKALILAHLGQKPLEQGLNILGAHIDSPRLDLKQNPLYESNGFTLFDTHYYGGIKKYQWVAMPLAMHGVIVKKDGTSVNVVIGEDENDPVLYITDLLPHLGGKQMQEKAGDVIRGEGLDILIGSRPLKDTEKDAVKEQVLSVLKEKYGVEEEDFLSAELEVVPAGKARECGLDRSMIAAYGQDDRVCAYTSFLAMADVQNPKKTACCLLVDKEEIGSVGATGMQSRFFENSVAELLDAMGEYSDMKLRRTLRNCRMLSSDVSAAYDPLYADVYEKKNSAYLGRGMVINKFTGARGKSGSNDANAEYIGRLRKIFDDNQVAFQTAKLGKVDVGGGGTIAYIAALYGMEVIDSGVAVLSMHAPWEVTSKADVYEAKKGYEAFLKEA